MFRGNNQGSYGQGPPFTPGDGQFRSPGPRFYQQAVPHYSGPGYPSPIRTPPHQHRGGPSPRGHTFARPYSPGNQGFHSRTPSPYNNHRGRGFNPYHSSPYTPKQGNKWKDCNPGGCDDIAQYYKPNMTVDPWDDMEPTPVTQSPKAVL